MPKGLISVPLFCPKRRQFHRCTAYHKAGRVIAVLLLFLLSITSAVTFAQDYPTKPVRLIEPFGAGGGVDTIARTVSNYVGVEKFNLEAGIQAVHVPPEPGAAITDVIANTVAGRTDYLIAPIPLALTDIRAGKLRALGVTTKRRSSLLPEVPTIAEAGVPGFDYPIWYGVWVPAGTPAGVVDKLAKDIARVLAVPDLRDQLAKHGADPMSMTQPEFADFVLSESESAARIIKAAGIKPQ